MVGNQAEAVQPVRRRRRRYCSTGCRVHAVPSVPGSIWRLRTPTGPALLRQNSALQCGARLCTFRRSPAHSHRALRSVRPDYTANSVVADIAPPTDMTQDRASRRLRTEIEKIPSAPDPERDRSSIVGLTEHSGCQSSKARLKTLQRSEGPVGQERASTVRKSPSNAGCGMNHDGAHRLR